MSVPRATYRLDRVYACVPGDEGPFKLSPCHQELLARAIPFTPAISPDESPTVSLKLVHYGVYNAEQIYNIILTPEYNEAHDNHLHCDLSDGPPFFE